MIADQLGEDWLTVTVDGARVRGAQLGAVVMRHGRGGLDERTTPGAATLQVHANALSTRPSIGSTVSVELSDDALTALGAATVLDHPARVRFAGDVTDAQLVRADGDPSTDAYLQLTAIAPAARLGHVTIGDVPWPAELDGARARRILDLAAAATGVLVGTVDPGTATVLARDVDAQPPLDLLDNLSVDTRGTVHLSRDGRLSWHDAEHRRAAAPVVELTPANLLPPTWTLDLAGVVNDVTVLAGANPDDEAATPLEVGSVDPASVARYGRLAARLTTRLSTADDAQRLADELTARRARPLWRCGVLSVELLRTLPATKALALLSAEPGALVRLVELPTWSPTDASTVRLFLEGWEEVATRHSWTVSYDAVPYSLLGAPMQWAEVDPAVTWADVPTDLTWQQSLAWHTG